MIELIEKIPISGLFIVYVNLAACLAGYIILIARGIYRICEIIICRRGKTKCPIRCCIRSNYCPKYYALTKEQKDKLRKKIAELDN